MKNNFFKMFFLGVVASFLFAFCFCIAFGEAVVENGVTGGVSWSLNDSGLLRIYPTDGNYGVIGDSGLGVSQKDQVKYIEVFPGVCANSNSVGLFSNYSACLDMDLSNLDVSNVVNMERMFANDSNLRHIDFSGWNTSNVTDMHSMFSSCGNKDYLDLDLTMFDMYNVTILSEMFSNSKLHSVDCTGWNVENVTTIDGLFRGVNINLLIMPDMHFSNATDADYVFYVAKCVDVRIPNWSFGKVKYMSGVGNFAYSFGFDRLDIRNWNLDGVIDMYGAFRFCGNSNGVEYVDFSGWHSNTLKYLSQFFEYAHFGSIDVSNWDMPVLSNVSTMFAYNSRLTDIVGLDSWNVPGLERVSYLFSQCRSLCNLDVSTWTIPNLIVADGVFMDCDSLTEINIQNWDFRNCTSNRYFFGSNNSAMLESVVIGENFRFVSGSSCYFNSSYRSTQYWEREDGVYGPFKYNEMYLYYTPNMAGRWIWGAVVYGCYDNGELTLFMSRQSFNDRPLVDIEGNVHSTGVFFNNVESSLEAPWNSSYRNNMYSFKIEGTAGRSVKPISCKYWFANVLCDLTCDFTYLDTSNCTSFEGMFINSTGISSVDLSMLNTENVLTMASMFGYCSSVDHIDLRGFNTRSLQSMNEMFAGCERLEFIDLTDFDTHNVTSMRNLFYNDRSLRSVDVSMFDTSSVVNMNYMFEYCSKLQSLDLSNFDMRSVTDLSYMYYGCSSLFEIKLGLNYKFVSGNSNHVLPTPSVSEGSLNTDRWIRVSDVVSYSPVELRDVYDGSTMSGTYVWEDAHFSVKFVDNNGAVGSMENASFLSTLSRNVLPKNKLYLFGHEFDHWEDESGNVYSDGGFLDGHNFVARSTVELKAVFVPVDTSIIIKDGEFEFDLAGGAEAVFSDIPGNTKYQIFEMTPSGWQLVDSVNSRDSVVVNGENVSVFRNHYDPESCQFVLSGSKRMIDARGEYYYPESNEYSFKLVRVFDSGFEDIEVVSNFENGSFQFSPVELNAVGIYEYNVVELLGDDPLVSYDDHVEHVVVRVVDDSSGCLTAIVEEDSDGLLFTNVVNNFGSICLTKHAVNVDGEDAWDDGIVFKFEVQFFDELDSAPRSVYADYLYNVACDNGWMYNRKTGIMTILLYKDEPSVVIDHIPFGLKYRVREIVN